MKLFVTLLLMALGGSALAGSPMLKSGPADSSLVEVECTDAMRGANPTERTEIERRFRSTIVLRCKARALKGAGAVQASDFSYKNRYAGDERVYEVSMSDVQGILGEVYGTIERDFLIGLPKRERPWIITLFFAGSSSDIVFVTKP